MATATNGDLAGPSRVGGLPRPGAAADAAAAAEFAAKKWVWIPDGKEGYLQAFVVREEQNGEISVCSLADGQSRQVSTDDLSKMNPPKFDKAEDIADLTFLNEASVVHNLRQRYFSGLIYTYSGLFLVAVNPYRSLPIYTDAVVASYKGRRREENAPHVFALADVAMRSMLEANENQSLLITGESGAGKTENTKKVIQYLAAIAIDPSASSMPSSSGSGGTLTRSASSTRHVMDHLRGIEGIASKKLGLLERQILQANPILEAFGNAQTIRNNNSSRFGKFVRIEFTSAGAIAGANIDWYLLEKSRVTTRSEKERSFHIFYQLLRGANADLKSKLLLGNKPEEYDYLKNTRKHVEGVDDASEWKLLLEALNVVGFSPEEQQNLFRVIAAILQVGNIQLADDRSEQARITNAAQVEKVCHVLGLPQQELNTALLRPRVKAGREWVTQARTRRQVLDEMAALCKTLYEKTFANIVDRINQALDRPTSKSSFIGVLDIAGFEIFETNSFEQLCINYTNEKLQQFFNHHMFVLEQEEYARENIEWDFVNFGLDLQPTIDLIESTTPIGILSCLDEECIMPKATDLTFTEKLNNIWSTNRDGTARDQAGLAIANEKGVAHGSTKYAPARFAQGFTIKHYAGNVEYRTDGWLEKNKDPLNDNLTRVLSESSDRFIASLFAEYAVDDEAVAAQSAPKRRVKRGAFRTVAQRHKEQLSSLMSQLSSTQPHFVRCIVPNPDKKPGKMNVPLVLEQLRCNGVLEGIRIARLGYPNRLLFTEFRNRYEVLTPGIIPRGYMDGRKACQRMVEALELDRGSFKIGLTKIFFKAGVLAEMEERRDRHLHDIFARFQAAARMFTARRQMKKILNRAAAVRTIQRNARLYVQLRDWPWWQLYTRVRPLLKATRHDEELKKKQAELAMITERAERDQREKEALEALRFQLENEKKKVEGELHSERALLVDKDQLLARSKERESALQEELQAMQADIDQLDNQLERAIAGQRTAEQARDELKVAFDAAAKHLQDLDAKQNAWEQREMDLMSNVDRHSEEVEKIRAERAALQKERVDLDRLVQAKEQDIERMQVRMREAVAELERKLTTEAKNREEEIVKRTQLEEQSRQSSYRLSELARASTDHEERIKQKEVELANGQAKLQSITTERDNLGKQLQEARAKIETLSGDLRSAKSEQGRTIEQQTALQRELDETRRLMQAKSSEDSKQKELQRRQEDEMSSLRQQMGQLRDELAQSKHQSLEQINSTRAEAETAKRQYQELIKAHEDLKRQVEDNDRHMTEASATLAAAERARRTAEGELGAIRNQVESHKQAIVEAQSAKDAAEKQLSASHQKHQDLEDALLELERDQSNWKLKADQINTELLAESKRRELAESAARQSKNTVQMLEAQLTAKDKEFLRMKDELALTQADLRKAQSMTNKTIVEHVHVLEQAKKMTDRQLQDALDKCQALAKQLNAVEKAKDRLRIENEDLNRENRRLQTDTGVSNGRGVLTTTTANIAPSSNHSTDGKMVKSLEGKIQSLTVSLREKDVALSDARRKELQSESNMSRTVQQYEARITELERELRGSQTARSTTFQNLADLVQNTNDGDDGAFRRKLLEELRAGHDELETDFAEKEALLRNHKMGNGASPAAKNAKPLYTFGNLPPSKKSSNAIVTPSDLRRQSGGYTNGNHVPASPNLREDENRRQLLADHRKTQARLESELAELRQRLGRETVAHNEEKSENRRLRTALQEVQINVASDSQSFAKTRDEVSHQRVKLDEYRDTIDQLEMEKLKAQKAENLAKRTLADVEHSLSESMRERRSAQEKIDELESSLHEAALQLQKGGRDWHEVEHLRKRMAEEFDEERGRYKSDIRHCEELIEKSRQRFQQELSDVTAEINANRAVVEQLREENRQLRNSYDELTTEIEHGALSQNGWQREKESMEARISDITRAYHDSLNSQHEAQKQLDEMLKEIHDQSIALGQAEYRYSQLQIQYNSLISNAGVDEDMINSLESAVEKYRSQAQLHFENWKKSTEDLQTQTKNLRSQATIRRPGSSQPEGAGLASPSRMSVRAM
ncbi:hypothetical protein L7F22_039294 [Adiantum nelumboides]|nr:hypothetical protein [Adiantum nelumboides]